MKDIDLSKITLTESEIDQYAQEQIEGWDMDSLVQFAVDTCFNEMIKMDRKHLIQDMTEYYGEDWLREKALAAFK